MRNSPEDDLIVKQYFMDAIQSLVESINLVGVDDIFKFGRHINEAIEYLQQGKHENCRARLGMAGDLIAEQEPQS